MEELKLKKVQLEENISRLISDFALEINNYDFNIEIEISKAKQGTRCVITNIKTIITVNL